MPCTGALCSGDKQNRKLLEIKLSERVNTVICLGDEGFALIMPPSALGEGRRKTG